MAETACCIAAALVLMAVGVFAAKRYNQQAGDRDIAGCKPSIELKLRGSGRVAQAKALNDDAQKLLRAWNWKERIKHCR